MAKYSWPEKPTLLSTPVKRLDGPDKVTGRARYSYDINRPGMLHGRIVRSPYPHARVVSVDLSAAEKAPGVKALLITIKPGEKVMFPGEEIGALAATTEQQAADFKAQAEAGPMPGDSPVRIDSIEVYTVARRA